MKIVAMLFLALFSASCASAPPAPAAVTSKQDLIDWFTAGQALACAQPDGTPVKTFDCPCTTAILTDLQATTGAAVPITGPVAKFIELRIINSKLQGGLPPAVVQACGGVVMDVGKNALNFGALLKLFGL